MMAANPKRPLVRAVGVIAAVAFGCAGISQLLHRADEVHAICAEHGEKVHLAHAAGDLNPKQTLSAAPDVPANNGHEQCGLCPTSRQAVPAVTQSTNHEAPEGDLVPECAPVEDDRALASSIYRTAPKASPPLAA